MFTHNTYMHTPHSHLAHYSPMHAPYTHGTAHTHAHHSPMHAAHTHTHMGQPCTSSTCMVTHVTMCPPCTPLGGRHMSLMRAVTCPSRMYMHASLSVYHVYSMCCIVVLCFTPNCEVIQIYNFTTKKYWLHSKLNIIFRVSHIRFPTAKA